MQSFVDRQSRAGSSIGDAVGEAGGLEINFWPLWDNVGKEAFLQVHGKLTSAGTSRQSDAALLSGEEGHPTTLIWPARIWTKRLR